MPLQRNKLNPSLSRPRSTLPRRRIVNHLLPVMSSLVRSVVTSTAEWLNRRKTWFKRPDSRDVTSRHSPSTTMTAEWLNRRKSWFKRPDSRDVSHVTSLTFDNDDGRVIESTEDLVQRPLVMSRDFIVALKFLLLRRQRNVGQVGMLQQDANCSTSS